MYTCVYSFVKWNKNTTYGLITLRIKFKNVVKILALCLSYNDGSINASYIFIISLTIIAWLLLLRGIGYLQRSLFESNILQQYFQMTELNFGGGVQGYKSLFKTVSNQ